MVRKPYKSDLTDGEWEIIKGLIPPPKPGGRPRSVNIREILNAIFYVLRTGCSWNMLPHDFPPSSTVYYYFRRWQRKGVWEEIEETMQSFGRKSLIAPVTTNVVEEQYGRQRDRVKAPIPLTTSTVTLPTPVVKSLHGADVRQRA